MAETPQKVSHQYGANRKEVGRKVRKHDPNFAQSRDVREDRGVRQMKMAILPRTVH